MTKLSVVIITLNEEKNIERCLRSVMPVADEIVVVDSSSTDRTCEIAQQHGARVVTQAFMGYVKQRAFADECATHNHILAIDADEVLSAELQESISEIKKAPKYNAYRMARLNFYCGLPIKHGGWYPDKKLRLYDRTKGKWHGEMVHEHWQLNHIQEPVGILKGDLLHYTFNTISDHIKQIEKFTEMSARAAVAQGKDCSLLKVWLGPKWTFFAMYIIKLGFLDGYYGLLVCKFSAMAAMIKYAKIRQYARLKREGRSF